MLWRHRWQEASEFLCTKTLVEWVEHPKISPKNPGNAFSDALLTSRFQNFAADAAKKKTAFKTALRAVLIHELIRGQRFWETIFFTIGDIAIDGICCTGMLADIFFLPRPASSFIPVCNIILGHPQMPIASLPTEKRFASFSILVYAGSEYLIVRYRADPSIDML